MSKRKNDPLGVKSRILEQAGQEFLRHGYEGARLNQIIVDAGMTKGALFHHFSSKEDLARKWYEAVIPNILEEVWRNSLEGNRDPLSRLEEIFSLMMAPDADRIHSISWSSCGLDNAIEVKNLLKTYFIEWHEIVMKALEFGQNEKTVHPAVRASDEAQMILSLAQGIAWQQRVCGNEAVAACVRSVKAYLATLRPA